LITALTGINYCIRKGIMALHYIGIFIVGIIVGFLGGLFGKGGSSIATPMLNLIGVPGFVAVAAPLPATVPGTFVASLEYWKLKLIDWQVVRWSIFVGVPASVIGSWVTKYTGALPLLVITGLLVLSFGMSFIVSPREKHDNPVTEDYEIRKRPSYWRLRLVSIATFVGFVSGLLANAGGFLLAPSFARILGLPIKKAFACSLAVSIVLAIPGTVVHAYLGHIDWLVTLVLATGSVPASFFGARIAIRSRSSRLERAYGIILIALGVFFLIKLM
jgi:uncharacterized membrane protein YfcA